MESKLADINTNGLRLNKAGLERDLAANPRKSRLSWNYACGALARNATLNGDTTPGWTTIMREINEATGQKLTPAEYIRAKNRQPVAGLSAMLMDAFGLAPESAIAQVYARSEAAALDYGEQLDTSRATMADMFRAENADAVALETLNTALHTDRQQALNAYADPRPDATKLHVANPGHVNDAMQKIVAAGPTANRFDSILQAVQGRSR